MSAALRLIKGGGSNSSDTRTTSTTKRPLLSTEAWALASVEERRKFLDGIDLATVLAAAPPSWRTEPQPETKNQFIRLPAPGPRPYDIEAEALPPPA